jgi:PPP family 3-phenylpropionic acid transporter
MKSSHNYIKFSGQYFFNYFALGALLPLLSIYLIKIGLSGIQIGIISSMGAFIAIFSPPFWGIVSDKTRRHKPILMGLMVVAAMSVLIIPLSENYYMLLPIFGVYYLASSTINPLIDGITIQSNLPFGKVRLWGSVGFAVAALLVGKLAEMTELSIIFYAYVVAIICSIAILLTIQVNFKDNKSLMIKDVKKLMSNKLFIVFLIYLFLVCGTLMGHNIFFGLLFEELGGDATLIGLAFMLFALSEAPIMQITPYFIRKYGVVNMMTIAPMIGAFRWLLHAIIPSPTVLLALFFLQGLFYAPFLLGVTEFIQTRIPNHLKSTSMTIYSAVGFGMGGVVVNFISGILYDYVSAKAIYGFYAILCALSIGVVLYLRKLDHSGAEFV